MGLVDAFSAEDRINVKFSEFYSLVKESAKAEIMMNGIKNHIPHSYIEVMMTGRLTDSDAEELKTYRALGLSPDDVKLMDELYSEKCSELADVKRAYAELRGKPPEQNLMKVADCDSGEVTGHD